MWRDAVRFGQLIVQWKGVDLIRKNWDGAIFVGSIVASGVLPLLFFEFPKTASEFGEAFGFMGALFGGFALFYLALSVKRQSEANSASAQAIRASTKLAAMTALADHLRGLIDKYREWENSARTEEKKKLWRDKRQDAQASLKNLMKEMWAFAELTVAIEDEAEP